MSKRGGESGNTKKSKKAKKSPDVETEEDTVFDYASTVEGKLFQKLPLPDTAIAQAKQSDMSADDHEELANAVCDSAESIMELITQLGFGPDDVPTEIKAVAVLYKYMAQVENGGFSQWVFNTKASENTELVASVREAMGVVKASLNLACFDEAMGVLKGLPATDVTAFEDSEYFGDGPHASVREKLDNMNDKLWALLGSQLEGEEKGESEAEESLAVLLYKYAVELAARDDLVVEVKEDNTDPLELLVPTWWPDKIPECDIKDRGESRRFLSGLRRAAAGNGFGFVKVGWAAPVGNSKKKKNKNKAPPIPDNLPDVFSESDVVGDDDTAEASAAGTDAPQPISPAFWIVSTVGPMICKVFMAPPDTAESGAEQKEEKAADEELRMAVFFSQDGQPCGMGPFAGDEDDDEEEEGDFIEFEDDEDCPDLVPV